MKLLAGWPTALRLARRDAVRARGRSLLVLVMIALPVLAVTAADVVYATEKVSGTESLDRRLGTADARLVVQPGLGRVVQGADPDVGASSVGSGKSTVVGLPDIGRILGHSVPATETRDGVTKVTTDAGAVMAQSTELDLRSPLTQGLFRLSSGRWATRADEVDINAALASHGFAIGDSLTLAGGDQRRVVGIAESSSVRSTPEVAGPLGSLALSIPRNTHTWYVGGGPVTWDHVLALNRLGVTVLSRDVLLHPPSDSALPANVRDMGSQNDAQLTQIVILVVVMALLELVLLAGPAFAVSARRHSRTLALMAASGGTPRQSRRVILASGLVLGTTAAVAGAVLGIGTAYAVLPFVQRMSGDWFGPFDVNVEHVLGIVLFGLASAVLAAVVPAWIASRQDVVAVLSGRRGDRAPSLKSPVLGVLLLGAGVVGAGLGAQQSSGEFLIAIAAVLAVLGMILLVPLVVTAVARLGARLPLPLRYAVRDAARHRTRTVPAVAAVAATVAGVVALGIANSSDAAQNRETYTPVLPMGQASLSVYQGHRDWPAYAAVVRRIVPGATVTRIRGLPDGPLHFRVPGTPGELLDAYGGSLGSTVLVDDRSVPVEVRPLTDAERARVRDTLGRGGAVVFTSSPVDAAEVTLRGKVFGRHGHPQKLTRITVPALFLPVQPGAVSLLQGVIAPSVAHKAGVAPETVGLLASGTTISKQQEADVNEVMGGLTDNAYFYVERGYQDSNATKILLLILGCLGGVLMLGGTLTATFLALSDARPDLATLSAVGAAPRTRRGVAAAYAVVIGLVGAVLGALVGFIPGIAVTYPLTRPYSGHVGPSHYLDVPWLLIGSLVVVLPLLTAAVVGLTARSRLPLVARLD